MDAKKRILNGGPTTYLTSKAFLFVFLHVKLWISCLGQNSRRGGGRGGGGAGAPCRHEEHVRKGCCGERAAGEDGRESICPRPSSRGASEACSRTHGSPRGGMVAGRAPWGVLLLAEGPRAVRGKNFDTRVGPIKSTRRYLTQSRRFWTQLTLRSQILQSSNGAQMMVLWPFFFRV